jgi:hypothetical protein
VTPAPDFRPLEMRLAPEHRRCASYIAIGYSLMVIVAIGLKLAEANDRSWPEVVVMLAAFGAALLVLVALLFRYRIRIDQHGVWRRRLVRWDLWPWEAFEQAKVRHGKGGDQLTYPEKPWYWRTISASVLAERDRAAYETVVRRYRVPPPPPSVPDMLDIKYGIRARLELSADGVRCRAHKHDDGESIPWPDVVRAELIRTTHDRPDFSTLELHLPGRPKPVRLTQQQGNPTWSGANAEVIALYLRQHLDSRRFQVTAQRGPPVDVAEADRRLTRLDESDRELRKLRAVTRYMMLVGTLVIAIITLEPWNRPNPANWGRVDWANAAFAVAGLVVIMALYGALIFGVVFYWSRELSRQRDEVLCWRAELASAEG